MTTEDTSAKANLGAKWDNIDQVGLYGGIYGGGVKTTAHDPNEHPTAWSRLWLSGSKKINLERRARDSSNLADDTTFTVYAVESWE